MDVIWTSEVYQGLTKTSKKESFATIVNGSELLPILAKRSVLDLGGSIGQAFEHPESATRGVSVRKVVLRNFIKFCRISKNPFFYRTPPDDCLWGTIIQKNNTYLVEIKISSALNSSIILSSYRYKICISTIGFIFNYITIFFFIFLYFHIFPITDFKNSWLDLIPYVVVLSESKIML